MPRAPRHSDSCQGSLVVAYVRRGLEDSRKLWPIGRYCLRCHEFAPYEFDDASDSANVVPPLLVHPATAAAQAGVERQTVYKWLDDGLLAAYRKPGHRGVLVDVNEVKRQQAKR